MTLDLTRQTFLQSISLSMMMVVLYVVGFLFFGPSCIADATIVSGATFIGNGFQSIASNFPNFTFTLQVFLILINSLFISRIYIRSIIHIKRSHIASLIYLFLSCSAICNSYTIVPHIVAFMMMSAVSLSLRVKKHRNCARNFFLAYFYIGAATILFLPAIVTVSIPLSLLFVNQRFYPKELLSSLVGLLLPFFMVSYYFWLFEADFLLFFDEVYMQLLTYSDNMSLYQLFMANPMNIVLLLFVVVIALWAVFKFINSSEKRRRLKNALVVFWTFAALVCVLVLLFPALFVLSLPILSIPFSFLVALFFNQNSSRMVANIVFILFVTLSVVSLLFGLFI
ncbi:MAG: hypothetical protein R3Y04_04765 [Rikenellaceae bacterium]